MPAKRHVMHGRDHACHGADPIPGICNIPDPSGTDLADLILATPGLDAFWKLNETAGTVAADSSGNGHDLDTSGGYTAPAWGQPAGPPGETSAGWGTSTTRLNAPAGAPLTAFTDNFSAGIWVNVDTLAAAPEELLGQGTSYHVEPGWNLMIVSGKFAVAVAGNILSANNALSLDTWYFIAVVREAGTWKLYVNGLLQTATLTTSPGTGYGNNTWLGNDAYPSHTTWLHDSLLSYAFIANTVLTSTQLLDMYEAGTSGGTLDPGLVWTTDGAGSASWQPASGGGGGHTIADEGAALTARPTLDFIGAGVTATDDAANNKTKVTIPGANLAADVPAGGTAGQVLTKDTATDYDTSWQPAAAGTGLPADTVIPAGTRIISNKLVAGDAQPVWREMGDGKQEWGSGGASAPDTNLYRAAPNLLRTDGNFQTLGVLQPLGGFATSGGAYGTAFPSAVDGQEFTLVDNAANPSYQWRFRYNAGSSSPYKWEFVGGAAAYAKVDAFENSSSATYVDLTTFGPALVLPRNGDYLCRWGHIGAVTTAANAHANSAVFRSGVKLSSLETSLVGVATAAGIYGGTVTEQVIAGVVAGTVNLAYKVSAGTFSFAFRYLSVTPVRVS